MVLKKIFFGKGFYFRVEREIFSLSQVERLLVNVLREVPRPSNAQ